MRKSLRCSLSIFSLAACVCLSFFQVPAAYGQLSCIDTLSVPVSPLVAHEIETLPEEIGRAGEIVSRGQRMRNSEMQSGTYIYIITTDGQISFSPRVRSTALDQPYLVTHRSLVRNFYQTQHRLPLVVSAGEFRIENGRVTEVNNRSGTFRGGVAHLAFADRMLQRAGLPIEANTHRQDYSQEQSNVHTNARKAAEIIHQVHQTPALAQELQVIQQGYARLAEQFPNQARPGLVDSRAVLDGVNFGRLATGPMSDVFTVSLTFMQYIEESGLEVGLNLVHRDGRVTPAQVINFLLNDLSQARLSTSASRQ